MVWVALIAVVIAALDQFTKWLVQRSIGPADTRVVIDGFFSLVNWRNTGAAWGMFQHYNLLLIAVSVSTMLALWWFRRSFPLRRPGARLALGLIAGGIFGNLIDRIRLGSVIDFLNFSIGSYHWPAFNVADSAICIGVGLYILLSWGADNSGEKRHAAVSS
ncbi:MAG TPA: signal peptidase II [Verrucomicrobiae bacterium]|nr:signal peptidase II [Verrucomicrobiae bacterium]